MAALQAAGGSHSLDDFGNQRSDYVEPISGSYRDHELVELPPNGQGAAAILLAGILEQFDLASMDPFGTERTHIEAEATKLAYDARNRFIADPTPRLAHLLDRPNGAGELAETIDLERADGVGTQHQRGGSQGDGLYHGGGQGPDGGFADLFDLPFLRRAACLRPKFGILFHNRGAGFSLEELATPTKPVPANARCTRSFRR